jgi:hypothetical protein
VIDGKTGQTGFVDRGAIISATPGKAVPDISPVFDANGKQIAHWGNGLGWLSRSEVESPSFDYQRLFAESQRNAPTIPAPSVPR